MGKNIIRKGLNRILHLLARFGPGVTTLRPFLHKLLGVKIYGGNIFLGEKVYIENEYPELVEIYEGVRITLHTTIMAYARGPGKVIIEINVYIGPSSIIIASAGETTINGEGALLAAGSVVNKSITPFTFVGGVPAKPIAKITIPLEIDTKFKEWKNGLRPL